VSERGEREGERDPKTALLFFQNKIKRERNREGHKEVYPERIRICCHRQHNDKALS
jgi:hypothetical protein